MDRVILILTISFLIVSISNGFLISSSEAEKDSHHEVSDHHEVSEHPEEEDGDHEEDEHEKPSSSWSTPPFHIPIPQIHFPQITFPQIHFPPLPHLPEHIHIPKPFKKDTVTATRTVFIETTKRVTRHPVCVTAYGPKPPCLPHHYDELRELENNLEEMYLERASAIEPTKVAEIPSVRSTSILESAETLPAEIDASVDQSAGQLKRNARYLVAHPQFRDEYSAHEEQHHPDSDRIIEGILKNTHYITKTLYVTKVEKTIDHKVTATLVAKNCIPTEPKIPQCGPIHYGVHHVEWKESDQENRK